MVSPSLRRARLRRSLLALLAVALAPVLLAQARAQAHDTRLEVGIAGHLVVGAWNPVRLIANDVPPGSVLIVTLDQGSLRAGAIPAVLSVPVSGGGGVSVVEERLYVPAFNNITWSLSTAARVIGSGSLPGREQDSRPLDIVVSRQPGRYASSFASEARVIDLNAAELPLQPAAYDGVRSVLIDGSGTAPRLEAIAAAATGGALVVLHGDLPSSHDELRLLADGSMTRLGAGAVMTTGGAPVDAVAVIEAFSPLDRTALVESLTAEPLVMPPAPAPQALVLAVAAAFGLVVIALMRLFSTPGVVSAVLLAALMSFAGWRALRPAAAELVGSRTLALAGGELALTLETREYFSLPATVIHVPGGARPLRAQPYRLDRAGMHVALPRWRSLIVVMPADVAAFPLRLQSGALSNSGAFAMNDVIIIGLGPQGSLQPGATRALGMAEQGLPPALYAGLTASLPRGSLVASSGCPDACTVWLAPSLVDVMLLDPEPAAGPEESL